MAPAPPNGNAAPPYGGWWRSLPLKLAWLAAPLIALQILSAADPPIEIRRAIVPTSPIVTKSTPPDPRELPRADAPKDTPTHVLLPTTVAPIIDGNLHDVCWQSAPIVDEFTQVEPKQGAKPSERTEVRLLYNEDYLFIGVRCFDREPNRIVAKQMQRDADLGSDDYVAFAFDPFGGKRSGYLFKISPGGATQDALIGTETGVKTEWDTIWTGQAQIDKDGWTAEMAIPFKSISFDANATVWGWNVERVIQRKQEMVRWASPHQNKALTSLANLGQLRELSGIRKGLGLEIKPSAIVRHAEGPGAPTNDLIFDPAFDVFYSVTPSLTAAVTYNTDFAEADVDKRQVNLTRFPLFFPEKRDFFLQDANLFGFNPYKGPIGFHSRRIGLGPRGEIVDLMYGGKLAGRVGNLDVGLLDVHVDDTVGVPDKHLGVARASYRLLEESSIGGMFTYGHPHRDTDNFLIGTDLTYRTSHLFDDKVFSAQSWAMKTETPGADDGEMAFGFSARYPNEPVNAEIFASQIDEDFNPALGFTKRKAARTYGGELGYRWRPENGFIRSWGISTSPFLVTNLENVVETEALTLPSIDFLTESGDTLSLGATFNRENFVDGYEIYPGVFVPGADYRYNRGYATILASGHRPVSGFAGIDAGEFFDGHSRDYSAGIDWRATSHAYFGLEASLSDVDLPGGSFDVVVGSATANFAFTPSVSWNTIVQYDNASETVGLNSRFKWIVRPGSIVFLVVNYGFDVQEHYRTLSTDIATKVVWSFRF